MVQVRFERKQREDRQSLIVMNAVKLAERHEQTDLKNTGSAGRAIASLQALMVVRCAQKRWNASGQTRIACSLWRRACTVSKDLALAKEPTVQRITR